MAKRSSDEAQEASKQRKIDAWCKQRRRASRTAGAQQQPHCLRPKSLEDATPTLSTLEKHMKNMEKRERKVKMHRAASKVTQFQVDL